MPHHWLMCSHELSVSGQCSFIVYCMNHSIVRRGKHIFATLKSVMLPIWHIYKKIKSKLRRCSSQHFLRHLNVRFLSLPLSLFSVWLSKLPKRNRTDYGSRFFICSVCNYSHWVHLPLLSPNADILFSSLVTSNMTDVIAHFYGIIISTASCFLSLARVCSSLLNSWSFWFIATECTSSMRWLIWE